ncbi:MAG: HIRAN protein [Burkholderiales bacterium]|nr:HIRAN protein [Burkholderiales bacterium]
MRGLAAAVLAAYCTLSFAQDRAEAYLLVQVCFITAFKHYEGKYVFSRLRLGDSLGLIRERDNVDDANAVRVEWQGRTLGYVSRDANEAIARQLDFGNRLRARITRLSRHRDPNRRVEMEVVLPY